MVAKRLTLGEKVLIKLFQGQNFVIEDKCNVISCRYLLLTFKESESSVETNNIVSFSNGIIGWNHYGIVFQNECASRGHDRQWFLVTAEFFFVFVIFIVVICFIGLRITDIRAVRTASKNIVSNRNWEKLRYTSYTFDNWLANNFDYTTYNILLALLRIVGNAKVSSHVKDIKTRKKFRSCAYARINVSKRWKFYLWLELFLNKLNSSNTICTFSSSAAEKWKISVSLELYEYGNPLESIIPLGVLLL